MRGYLQVSSWISITLVKICFSRLIIHKPRKRTFELVGTVLKRVVPIVPAFKDCAYYRYCVYVLGISSYSDLSVMLTNAGIFLRGLRLCRESGSS